MKRVLSVLVGLLVLLVTVTGRASGVAVQGTVVDPAGYVIPGATVELLAPDGSVVRLMAQRGTFGGSRTLAASVEPGTTYLVRVHQPDVSAVIALDTSPSIDLTPVTPALEAYARDIVKGEEGIQIVPFSNVDADFAATEGEGDGSLAYWQRTHKAFFGRECRRLGREFSLSAPVACERFAVVYRGAGKNAV